MARINTSPDVLAARVSEIGILKHLAHFDCKQKTQRCLLIRILSARLRICERYNFPLKNPHCHCKTAKKLELDLLSFTDFNSALPKTKKTPKNGSANKYSSHKIHHSKNNWGSWLCQHLASFNGFGGLGEDFGSLMVQDLKLSTKTQGFGKVGIHLLTEFPRGLPK